MSLRCDRSQINVSVRTTSACRNVLLFYRSHYYLNSKEMRKRIKKSSLVVSQQAFCCLPIYVSFSFSIFFSHHHPNIITYYSAIFTLNPHLFIPVYSPFPLTFSISIFYFLLSSFNFSSALLSVPSSSTCFISQPVFIIYLISLLLSILFLGQHIHPPLLFSLFNFFLYLATPFLILLNKQLHFFTPFFGGRIFPSSTYSSSFCSSHFYFSFFSQSVYQCFLRLP